MENWSKLWFLGLKIIIAFWLLVLVIYLIRKIIIHSLYTKAQIAALDEIESIIEGIKHRINGGYDVNDECEWIAGSIETIHKMIKEYDLKIVLLNESANRIYKYLIKSKRFDSAASLAKKYNL